MVEGTDKKIVRKSGWEMPLGHCKKSEVEWLFWQLTNSWTQKNKYISKAFRDVGILGQVAKNFFLPYIIIGGASNCHDVVASAKNQ